MARAMALMGLVAGLLLASGATAQYATVLEAAQAAGNLNLIAQGAIAVGLGGLLTDTEIANTFFLPTDSALLASLNATGLTITDFLAQPALVQAILGYHVVPVPVLSTALAKFQVVPTLNGALLTVQKNHAGVRVQGQSPRNRAWVQTADILAAKSVIHVINNVLLPPYPSIVAAAGANGLSLLSAALAAAELNGTLSAPDLVATVFAPTDAAIAALINEQFDGNATALLSNKALLTTVLTYHVVPGAAVLAEQLASAQLLTTLQTSKVRVVKFTNGKVAVRGGSYTNVANVVYPNMRAGAAIIHVIDKVLLPPTS